MTRRRIWIFAGVLFAALTTAAACRALVHRPGPNTVRRSLTVDGRERSYLLHVPPAFDRASRPAPVRNPPTDPSPNVS